MRWLFFSLFSLIFISNGFGKSSKLVQIACNRNPELSFCDDPIPIDPKPSKPNASKGNESKEIESILNLPTFEETLVKNSENETIPSAETTKKVKRKNRPTTTPSTTIDEEEVNEGEEIVDGKTNIGGDPIPDDPILSHPAPSTRARSNNPKVKRPQKEDEEEENNDNETEDEDEDRLGSLLRLPKPPRKNSQSDTTASLQTPGIELITPPDLPGNHPSAASTAAVTSKTKPPPKNSRVGFVNVYISQFCVDRRKEFLVKCRTANVSPKDIEFCKSYPIECQSDENGVVPLLAYCERFIHAYVRTCAPKTKRDRQGRQFCKAYDQFCVPPPTPADLLESNQALTRCEDIQPEARKVCNPFPPPHDRLNYLRCSQFIKFCSKYVDWQQ
jgi:hypothetical protein